MPVSAEQQGSTVDRVLSVAVAQAFDAVMVTSANGIIVYVNKAFENMTGYSAHEAIGATPRILKSGKQDAAFYELYWRELLSGRGWRGRMVNRRKNGELYVEEHTATPVFDSQGQLQYLISVGRDVTEQERTLEMLESILSRMRAATGMEDALESTLRLICEATHWVLGEAWIPSGTGGELVCVRSWGEDDGLDRFRLATQSVHFRRGEGLPGRAWDSLQPEWQPDVWLLQPGQFPRKQAARDAGLHAGFAVPIVAGGDVLAVLCFFVREPRDEDSHLIRVVSAMAAQLGEHLVRIRAEIEARRLAAIVESSVDAIVGLDTSGVITSWNRGAEALYGYTAEEMVGSTKSRIVPPDRADEVAVLTRYVLEGIPVPDIETVRLAKDGRVIDVMLSVSPVEGADGRLTGVATVARDVTEKRRVEKALREQDYNLREAQRVAKVGSWAWFRNRDDVVWSDEMYRIMGLEPGTPVPGYQAQQAMYSPESGRRLDAAVRKALADGSPIEMDAELVRGDGTRVNVLVQGEPDLGDHGEVVGLRGIVQDISERKRVEAELLRSQRLDSIGRLAGGVAHDFNNLLTAIQGFAYLAASGLPAGDPVRADLDEIVACVNRGAALTQQLLAFSRHQPVLASLVDGNDVLRDMERLLSRLIGDDIQLSVELAPEPARLLMDRGQLEQVVVNLAVNARDAMPSGGRLTLSLDLPCAADLPPEVQLTGARFVRLMVADGGEGMDEATLPHIFEPFFTTKDVGKGAGLGLATCYGIVKQAGGEITVRSGVGLGTTFEVYLPYWPDEPAIGVRGAMSPTPGE